MTGLAPGAVGQFVAARGRTGRYTGPLTPVRFGARPLVSAPFCAVRCRDMGNRSVQGHGWRSGAGTLDPRKGGEPCPGRSIPCPNNGPPWSTPSAPPACRSPRPPAATASAARPPTSGWPASTPTPPRPLADRSRRPGGQPGPHPERRSRPPCWRPATAGAGGRASSTPCSRPRAGRPRRCGPSPRSSAATAASPRRPRPHPPRPRNGSSAAPPTSSGSSTSRARWRSNAAASCPLSVLDDHSRYLLALRPCTDLTYATVQAVLWDLFGDVGLPEALLCDNAFCGPQHGRGAVGLRRLADPAGHPADPRPALPPPDAGQGRAVPRDAARPSCGRGCAATRLAHFAADLEAWRPVYNAVRPHEALGDEPPVTRWRPSPRRRPAAVPAVELPGRGRAAGGGPGRGDPLPPGADPGRAGPGRGAGAGGRDRAASRGLLRHVPGAVRRHGAARAGGEV